MKTAGNKYIEYLKERLRRQSGFVFEGELAVRKAITSFDARGKFLLLYLYQHDMYLYNCQTDDTGEKFRIMEYCVFNHSLDKVFDPNISSDILEKYSQAFYRQKNKYIYDDYYNELCPDLAAHNQSIEQALSNLPIRNDSAIFVDGNNSNYKSVIYALQHKAASVVSMVLESSTTQRSPKMLKCWFPNEIKSHIQTDPPIALLGCLSKPSMVFVPLNETSLDSAFWGDIKWRDVIPNEDKDCCITDVDCKYLTLKIEVDGFQNIFCRITDINQQVRYLLMQNAHNAKFQEKELGAKTNKVNDGAKQMNPSKKGRDSDVKADNTIKTLSTEAKLYTHFIVDTNSLIYNPDIIPSIASDKSKKLIIPLMVTREINKLKDRNSDIKRQATINYKNINKIYKGNIILNETATQDDINELPLEVRSLSLTPDDYILAIAIRHKLKGENICLITDEAGFWSACEKSLGPKKCPGLLHWYQILSTK